ncbi:MAG: alkylation response protein AidB-like acyl-CoA dehydrogenase [Halieaceae bacterium]|jgi:alkylation response protein AidB-like acyl-CoA dehydrogenase
MNIQFTLEQLALRDELRVYFADLMTPELSAECERDLGEGGGPLWRAALRQIGKDGWIGLGWPKAWGGREMTPLEQFIFVEEVMRAGYPFPFLTTESVGPMLAEHASDSLQQMIVPKILAGECLIAIGYSELDAGTDLANLKTTAVRDGDHWLINGQKMWTSLAHFCDYTWLAVRTDTEAAKKHKGITLFLVPNSDPGWSCTPVHTLGGVRTNATYYDNIRVSDDMRVGEVNGGWKLITGQLNRERVSLINFGPVSQLFNQITRWACNTALPGGGRVVDQGWVQQNLARCRADIECMKLIVYKQSWAMTENTLAMADASAAKVYGSEAFVRIFRSLGEVMGQAALFRAGSEDVAVEAGRIERLYRTASIITFGGGTNEIQRDIISAAGLWMPRASR